MKYGIFEASAEMKKRPLTLAEVVMADENISSPKEIFDTEEAALAVLKEKYHSDVCKKKGFSNVSFYSCVVYFMGECEYRFEGEDDNDITVDTAEKNDLIFNSEEGFEVAPIERFLALEPKKFMVMDDDEKIEVSGCKVTTTYDVVYFKCDVNKLERYYEECMSEKDLLENMTDNEKWFSKSYKQQGDEIVEID